MVDVTTCCQNQLTYPDIPSSVAPVSHSDTFPIPSPPTSTLVAHTSSDESLEHLSTDEEYCQIGRKPHYPNQCEMNDLIRDLGLCKANGELLISRLKEWNLLSSDVFCSF